MKILNMTTIGAHGVSVLRCSYCGRTGHLAKDCKWRTNKSDLEFWVSNSRISINSINRTSKHINDVMYKGELWIEVS